MSYLPLLTEDEVRYICSVIPHDFVTNYFQRNPKELAKIRPGFRAKAITKNDVSKLLFKFRTRDFISSFIEQRISEWLVQIQNNIDRCVADGEDNELALLHTLSLCFFADNIALYFKLSGEERSDEAISLMNASVKEIREANAVQNSLGKELKAKEAAIEALTSKCESLQSRLKDAVDSQQQKVNENAALRLEMVEIIKLRAHICEMEAEVNLHKKRSQENSENIQRLTAELSAAMSNKQLLEKQIREELVKQQAKEDAQRQLTTKPKKPADINQFVEYLGYNLTSLGVMNDTEHYRLLNDYLSKICFTGIPNVANRLTGMNIAKCVANVLTGSSAVKTLVYRKDILDNEINAFLSSAGRVVCMDNFIGNCNETELLPVFNKHKDKIIFLTIAYERTMRYVSDEFLRYCHYLNLNRIAALSADAELIEDPSTLEEVEYMPLRTSPDNRYATIMRQVLHEIGFCKSLIEQKSAEISSEKDLCSSLAFDVLPYCVDVLQIAPYHTSERLVKYAGDAGRCPCGSLLREWFAR